ncbi:polysaccharide deacetylase family protein [Enterococcus sp. LJL99]
MTMNQEPQNRANTRRSRQAKRKKSKVTWYYWLVVFALLVSCVGSYAVYTHLTNPDNTAKKTTENKTNDDFKQKEDDLLASIREKQKTEGIDSNESIQKQGKVEIITYLPKSDELKSELATIEENMNQKINTIEQTKKEAETKIVAQIKKGYSSDTVTEYQPVVDTYVWNNNDWIEEKGTLDSGIAMNNQTNKLVSLHDLFDDNEANLLAVRQVIQQKILSDHPNDDAVLDQVLAIPNLTLDDTPFTYQSDAITLTLPETIADKKEVTVPYNDIVGFINTDFIDKSKLSTEVPQALDPNQKYISLTFDDGPNPATTPRLLDILKEKGVTATFFMLGQNVSQNEELAKRVYDEGHEVASHSFSHPNLTTLDAATISDQVNNTDKAIYNATGTLPTDFRPPYGAVNKDVAEIIGKPIIQWSVDSQDWQSHNKNAIVKRVDDTAYNDSIILMHDIYPETIDAVPIVIDHLRAAGYEIIPSKQLLMNKAKPLHMYYGSTDERPVQ